MEIQNVAMSPSKWEINWQGLSLHENITLNQNQIFKTLQVIRSILWNIEKNDSEMFKKWSNLIKWQCYIDWLYVAMFRSRIRVTGKTKTQTLKTFSAGHSHLVLHCPHPTTSQPYSRDGPTTLNSQGPYLSYSEGGEEPTHTWKRHSTYVQILQISSEVLTYFASFFWQNLECKIHMILNHFLLRYCQTVFPLQKNQKKKSW